MTYQPTWTKLVMVVLNAVWCTSRDYVQWRKDLRVRWHQSLRFPASWCICDFLFCCCCAAWVLETYLGPLIHVCLPKDLYALLPAMSDLPCRWFCSYLPSWGISVFENLVVSGCAGVCGGLGCLRGQSRALLSSLLVRIPSATDSQTSPEILLVISCMCPKNNFGCVQEFFFSRHLKVHS